MATESIDQVRHSQDWPGGSRLPAGHTIDSAVKVPSSFNMARGNGLALTHCLWLCAVSANATWPAPAKLESRHPLLPQMEKAMSAVYPLHAEYAGLRTQQEPLPESHAALAHECHLLFMNEDGDLPLLRSAVAEAQHPAPNLLRHMDCYTHIAAVPEDHTGYYGRLTPAEFQKPLQDDHAGVTALSEEEVAEWEARLLEIYTVLSGQPLPPGTGLADLLFWPNGSVHDLFLFASRGLQTFVTCDRAFVNEWAAPPFPFYAPTTPASGSDRA